MKRLSLMIALILILVSGCATHSAYLNVPPKEPSKKYLTRIHPRVVLVLGSGSARGFAHAGVIKELEKNHIPIDLIVGTSAGSIVGGLYADNPSAASLQHLLLTTQRDKVIDFSLIGIIQGPISGEKLQIFLAKNLKATTFEKLKIPFIAVATDLETGKIHVLASGPIAPAINASSAAPPFFRPVKMYGKTFVDGGLVDPVAVDVAMRFHPKIIIAVNLSYKFSKTLPSYSPEVFLRGFDIMLSQLNEHCTHGASIIIHPDMTDTSMFEDENAERVLLMQAGEEATQKAIPIIKQLLAKNHIKLTKI